MKGLIDFVISFGLSTVLIGALYILAPKGALNKNIKFLFCLIYLSCILNSFFIIKTIDFDFETKKQNYSYNTDLVVSTAKETLKYALEKENIKVSKIDIVTDISSDGSIIFNEIKVYSNSDLNKIKQIIGNDSEYTVTVINE